MPRPRLQTGGNDNEGDLLFHQGRRGPDLGQGVRERDRPIVTDSVTKVTGTGKGTDVERPSHKSNSAIHWPLSGDKDVLCRVPMSLSLLESGGPVMAPDHSQGLDSCFPSAADQPRIPD